MRTLTFVCLMLCSPLVRAQLKPFYSAGHDKYGYKDASGKVVVSPKYDLAWEFREGMSPVRLGELYGYVNDQGVEAVKPVFNHAWMFSDGLSVVKAGDKYGFIDKTGKMVVPAIYDRADNFHGDRANVCLDKKWTVMIYHHPVNPAK